MRATRGAPPTARLRATLEVAHVLPRGWLQGEAALAAPDLVARVEAFYDGYAIPEFDVPDGPAFETRPARIEGFRLFAADIGDVGALEARLERDLAVTVDSRVAEIAPLLRLDHDVGVALGVLAACAAVGLGAALTALFWASVERKRRTLSMLALMGAPPRALAIFPLTQAALFALGGGVAALALFVGGAISFEALFADDFGPEGRVAPIEPLTLAAVLGGLLALAFAAAGAAAARAFRTDPATPLREEA
jgi:putative ABC transport system permease protein